MRPVFHRRGLLVLQFAAFLVLTLAATGCGSSSSSSTALKAGGTVRIGMSGDWTTLDPTSGKVNGFTYPLAEATYDRLVATGPDGKVLPYLAQSWVQTLTSITFTLRTDATCFDGTKVTPTVIANSLKAMFASGSSDIGRFLGAGPFTVTSDDSAATLTVSSGTPFPDALVSFAHPFTSIICPAGLDPAKRVESTFGSGPFTIQSAVHGDSIVFKVRKEWKWGPNGASASSPGFPDTVVFQVFQNQTTAANELLTGGLDLAPITGPDVPRLIADTSLTHKTAPSDTADPMLFYSATGHPTSDPAVREALATAIDRSSWNKVTFAGFGTVASSIIAPQVACYDAATAPLVPTPSVDKAKQILQADGYSAGSDGMLQKNGNPLVIHLIANPALAAGDEYLQAQFQAVGITVPTPAADTGTYFKALLAGNFDIAIVALTSSGGLGAIFLGAEGPPVGPPPADLGGITDSSLESEIHAVATSVGTERCQHFANVQEQFLKQHYLLPLVYETFQWFSKNVAFVPTAFDEPDVTQIRRTA